MAAICGATGAWGGELLQQCRNDERIAAVRVFTRRPLACDAAEVEQVMVGDFLDLSSIFGATGRLVPGW